MSKWNLENVVFQDTEYTYSTRLEVLNSRILKSRFLNPEIVFFPLSY